jgi:ABC-type multidrug transport system permease subunit
MQNLIKTIVKVIGVFVINAIAIILINFTISGLLAILTQSYFFGIVSSNAMLVFSVLGYFVGVIMSVFHLEENKSNKSIKNNYL